MQQFLELQDLSIATHTTFSARSSPLSSQDGLASASELIHLPYP